MGALCCNNINVEGSSQSTQLVNGNYKFTVCNICLYIGRICLKSSQSDHVQLQKKKFILYCSYCGANSANLNYVYQCNACKTFYCILHFYTHHKKNTLRTKPYKLSVNYEKPTQIQTLCQISSLLRVPKFIMQVDLSFSEIGNHEALVLASGIRFSHTLQGLST